MALKYIAGVGLLLLVAGCPLLDLTGGDTSNNPGSPQNTKNTIRVFNENDDGLSIERAFIDSPSGTERDYLDARPFLAPDGMLEVFDLLDGTYRVYLVYRAEDGALYRTATFEFTFTDETADTWGFYWYGPKNEDILYDPRD